MTERLGNKYDISHKSPEVPVIITVTIIIIIIKIIIIVIIIKSYFPAL